MKKITKILAIITVLAMTACLFASCGKSASGTATEGVLVMATNASFPPYEYKEGDNDIEAVILPGAMVMFKIEKR